MTNTVYAINKGINKQIEFKGIKAQYIGYLAAGLVSLLLLFAILYLCGLGMYLCVAVTAALGTALFTWVSRASHKYGRYGMMKKAAKKAMPAGLRFRSSKIFASLKQQN